MEGIPELLAVIVLGYLIGSFPTGLAVSKTFFGFDLRDKGSGNMGSTNAFRVLGVKWGIAVQIIDILKGFLAAYVVVNLLGDGVVFSHAADFPNKTVLMFIGGFSAVLGHIWTVFGKFKGGKGINAALGMLIAIAPIDVGIALLFFAAAVILSGYISLGSILAATAFPSSLFLRFNIFNVEIPGYSILIYLAAGVAAVLIFAHRTNIIRLLKGSENKFKSLQLIKFKKLDAR